MEESENKKVIIPLDILLNVDRLPFKITVKMMLEIAYYAIKLKSYQECEEYFLRSRGLKINDDTIRHVVNYIGGLVYEDDVKKANGIKNNFKKSTIKDKDKTDGVLYIMIDGAALNTRTKDKNGSSWRENKLAITFSSNDIKFWTSKDGKKQHSIIRREYISLIGTSDDFKYHVYALADRNGYRKYKETVIISDGAAWIRAIKEELFPDAQQILDLFHLKENVWDFSKYIFNKDENKYIPWANKINTQLENGEWEKVLIEIEKYKDINTNVCNCVNLYSYIWNNKSNIDYPKYKSKGFFVGSGAIESGNKVVLQSRLKLPGMRWNVETAQFALALKAKLESKLWDSVVVPLVMTKLTGHG